MQNQDMVRLEAFAERDARRGQIDIYILGRTREGKRYVRDAAGEWVESDPTPVGPELPPFPAALSLPYLVATQLLDELLACKLNPTDPGRQPGQVQAMKEHIADLRRVAFPQRSAADMLMELAPLVLSQKG